ncbi:YesL family protein [Aquibacillus albus]|uniref:Membrane protein YesL n=1 Tax=Aquibacillus albus TaxID=1168171 RepID=A0ABS2MWQ4_9BACI|nr:YesL family protein [Aquibacillus albus]MBM7570324.1 putative membrane protein YesL [Aquibacillus albus]
MDGNYTGGIYKICMWLMRFAYLNLLWLVFTLIGLVFLGFFPATSAMFSIERKWIHGQDDTPIFAAFWKEYKHRFIQVNCIGFLLSFFGLLIYINYQMISSVKHLLADVISLLLLGLAFLYVIVVIYIFPVYSHYNVKFFDYFKHAFFVGISSPLMTLLIGVSVMFFLYFSNIFPGIIPVFTGSCLSFITMWFAHCAFMRIEQKHLNQSNKTEKGTNSTL